jgi:choline dehydrogenase-like flavoprotein
MIVDLSKQRLGSTLRADTCVVGTGIGGGSFVVRYATGRGDLVVVEAGGLGESRLIGAESVGRDFRLPKTREVSLGGTGNLWRGLSSPLDPIDFTRREWIADSGWPIGRRELDRFYAEAGRLLGLPDLALLDGPSAHPAVDRRARDLQFDRSVLRNRLFVLSRPPRSFRQEIRRCFSSGDDLLLLNTTAVELITSADGSSVQTLAARAPGGDGLEIAARRFVLAAGALETPRLLLNSRRHDESGLGSRHGLVGRFLMDHPMGVLAQVRLPRPKRAPLYQSIRVGPAQYARSGLSLTRQQQRACRLPNHSLHLWPSLRRGIDEAFDRLRLKLVAAGAGSLTARDLATLLANPNGLYRLISHVVPVGAWYRYADLFFVTEQTPSAASSVRLSESKDRFGYPVARVDWSVSRQDLDSIGQFRELALAALAAGGNESTSEVEPARIGETLTSAAHHLGTARMSADQRSGVVDPDLKVWGTDNLYVCDGSVFPTAGSANPALTISALAIRLAEALKGAT